MAILGVDVGGTFTDAVLVEDGQIRTAKVPTAAQQEESVLDAARDVLLAVAEQVHAHEREARGQDDEAEDLRYR